MSRFEINVADLVGIKDKVVLITGGSSGIGLGTVTVLLSLGARVTSLDLGPPPADHSSNANFTFEKCNVTDWETLRGIFARTVEREGRLDAVFANAGTSPRTMVIDDEFDEAGQLKAPDLSCVETNLNGVILTVKLAVHHMRALKTAGSIVVNASASSWSRLAVPDYTTAKHAVVGLMRSLLPHLALLPGPRIRINCIAPNWTTSGLVSHEMIAPTGLGMNTPEQVARSAVVLMTDEGRNGQMVFIDGGRYWEVEKALGAAVGGFVKDTMPEGALAAGATDWERFEEFSRRMNIAIRVGWTDGDESK